MRYILLETHEGCLPEIPQAVYTSYEAADAAFRAAYAGVRSHLGIEGYAPGGPMAGNAHVIHEDVLVWTARIVRIDTLDEVS